LDCFGAAFHTQREEEKIQEVFLKGKYSEDDVNFFSI